MTITDASGVNGTLGTRPRVYYKKSTDANTVVDNTSATDGWKYVEANGADSPFDFTIDYSLVFGGSVAVGDVDPVLRGRSGPRGHAERRHQLGHVRHAAGDA